MSGVAPGQEYRCQWCQTLLPHSFAKCPARCARPPGFKLDGLVTGAYRGKSRRYVLTPLGWETAGYALVDGYWQRVR